MNKYLKEFIFFPDVTVMLIPFVGVLVYTIPSMLHWSIWIAIVLGMLAYALSEYLIHRFLFHMKTPESPFLLKMIKRLHYDHHFVHKYLKMIFILILFRLPYFINIYFVVYLLY